MRTSVIIPMFDAESTIQRAVQSVLTQSDGDWELIIVDDGSSDASIAMVQRFSDDRVRLIAHGVNRGISAARNSGVGKARGEFLAFLDADDSWEAEFLMRMHAATEGADAVVCGRTIVLPDGTRRTSHSHRLGSMSGAEAASAMLVGDITPFPWDKVIRRSAFAGLTYPEDIHRFEDQVVGVVALSRVRTVRSIPDALIRYHVAAGSLTWGRTPQIAETERALRFAEAELRDWLQESADRRRAFTVCRAVFFMLTAQSAMRSRDADAAADVLSACRNRITSRMVATTLVRKPVMGAGALLLKALPGVYRRLFTAYVRRQYALS